MRRWPAFPLFLQALGLVVATLFAALATSILVAFYLPQPQPEVYSVGDVARALHSGRAIPTREGRPLIAASEGKAPGVQTDGRYRQIFRMALAGALRVDPQSIVVIQNQPRLVTPRRAVGKESPAHGAFDQPLLFDEFVLGVRQADGSWLVVRPEPRLALSPWQERIVLIFGIAVLLVSPLAWWFARRMTAPMAAFAAAAERLGRDPQAPPIDIQGSSEVAAAVNAFNQMQERLRSYVNYRTSMIAAIAHDLRTPLTRLRFRIEATPDELQVKLARDIDEMEAMISATLAFVQDATRPRDRKKLEISSLVETVMDEAAETGKDAAVESADRVVIDGDPIALKRLVANLVDNALKFGSRARGRVYAQDGMAIVEVDDNGPGVPEDQVEKAFEPFHRLESSRSRDTGGIGLGLAVVRAIARSHGGDVALQNRAGGGLKARVSLPLEVAHDPA